MGVTTLCGNPSHFLTVGDADRRVRRFGEADRRRFGDADRVLRFGFVLLPPHFRLFVRFVIIRYNYKINLTRSIPRNVSG